MITARDVLERRLLSALEQGAGVGLPSAWKSLRPDEANLRPAAALLLRIASQGSRQEMVKELRALATRVEENRADRKEGKEGIGANLASELPLPRPSSPRPSSPVPTPPPSPGEEGDQQERPSQVPLSRGGGWGGRERGRGEGLGRGSSEAKVAPMGKEGEPPQGEEKVLWPRLAAALEDLGKPDQGIFALELWSEAGRVPVDELWTSLRDLLPEDLAAGEPFLTGVARVLLRALARQWTDETRRKALP